jgi:hypothetical protein
VKKTTVYLPDDLRAALKRAAAKSGKSQAALIREGVANVVARCLAPKPRGPLFDSSDPGWEPPRPRGPLFRSGDPTLAEHVDEALEGFGED